MRALSLAVVAALGGCTCDAPSKPAGGAGSARAAAGSGSAGGPGVAAGSTGSAGSAGSAAGSACTAETAIRVSRVLTDPAHPCRARILAAYGRMVRVGPGSAGGASGTIVSTAAARGAGVVVTCGTCAGAAGAADGRGLVDPERDPPLAFSIGAPARLTGDAVAGGAARREAHALFGGEDFSLAVIAGERLAPALDDPRGLAAARAPFVDVRPGASVLVLGFADAEAGELVASIGPVLAEDEARRRLPRAGAAAAPAYDPRAELAIAARALPGMLGGGAFDEAGRFVGVVVRAAAEPIDGAYLVRAVRATAIAARLSAALHAAPVPLRTRIVAFLP